MSIYNKSKKTLGKKIGKIAYKVTKPFLPFVILIIIIVFAVCNLIDSIFVQEVQADNFSLSQTLKDLKDKCIEVAKKLNGSDSKSGDAKRDKDNRESSKEIQWSQLYAIMAFNNLSYGTQMDEQLLNEVAKSFKSIFKYETITIKKETTTKDDKGNEVITVAEETADILVESNTIMGHYKYNYEDKVIVEGNTKTTTKVFTDEELIGKKYERVRRYLKDKLHVSEEDLDLNVEIIVQSATGYSDSEKDIETLLGYGSSSDIVTEGEQRQAKGMFTWPIPGFTKVTSKYGGRTHPIYGRI